MIRSVTKTDVGNGRASNQDAYLLRERKYKGKHYLMAAVCDGMGGLHRGEIASSYIIEVLKQWFDEKLSDFVEEGNLDVIQRALVGLIRKINQNLLLMSKGSDDTMGSTLTLLFIVGKRFLVLNVGDSRAYWFHQNHKFVTTDHTLVQLEVKAGHLTKEQARKDPRRHILVQCVGVTKDISVDCYRGRIQEDMEFLLCTDGFCGMLYEEEIYQVRPSKAQMRTWVERCFQKVKQRGELDNLSCILVHVSKK
jgi:protein phosphatase